MNKTTLFLTIFMLISLNLHCWDNRYAEYMPFMPYSEGCPVFDNDPLSKLTYNILMHNSLASYEIFKKNTTLITYKNCHNHFILRNRITDFDEQFSMYVGYIHRILENLMISDDLESFNEEFTRFSDINKITNEKNKVNKDYFIRCYYLYTLKRYEEFSELFSEEKIEKYFFDISDRKEFSPSDSYALEYYSKLIYLKDGNLSKVIEVLNDCFVKDNQPDTFFLLSRFIAKRDKQKAIDFLEEQIKLYYETRFDSPMLPYLHEIERIRMHLAYLCYEVGDIERALEHFHLAVDSKKNGSTFLGDWDFWLSDRDYDEGEYEIMLKLKELYIDQYRK